MTVYRGGAKRKEKMKVHCSSKGEKKEQGGLVGWGGFT